MTADVVIVGGGVIGLTSAYELATRGASVTVVDRSQLGTEASWAGAGMLPPALLGGIDPLKKLHRDSIERWSTLTAELIEQTGIDNGYNNCGALQIRINGSDQITSDIAEYQLQGVPVQRHSRMQLEQQLPLIGPTIQNGYSLPTMCQVRNPHHLRALIAACKTLGVKFIEHQAVQSLTVESGRVVDAVSDNERIPGGKFLVAAGAWSSSLFHGMSLENNHNEMAIEPVRGQIALLSFPNPLFQPIIEDGPQYLVPRLDGHVLVGSTSEHVGFEKATTPSGIQSLLDFAHAAVPELQNGELVKTWSGLRPCPKIGRPIIGPIRSVENLFIATGHFRDGLAQSPGTAQLITKLLMEEIPVEDLEPFACS